MKFLRFWFPLILYSGIIFYTSSIPNVTTPLPVPYLDNIIHLLVYGLFGYLAARAIRSTGAPISGKKLVLIAFIASLFYGATDEFHQMFVAGRSAEWIDLAADALGGLLGGIVFQRSYRNETQEPV